MRPHPIIDGHKVTVSFCREDGIYRSDIWIEIPVAGDPLAHYEATLEKKEFKTSRKRGSGVYHLDGERVFVRIRSIEVMTLMCLPAVWASGYKLMYKVSDTTSYVYYPKRVVMLTRVQMRSREPPVACDVTRLVRETIKQFPVERPRTWAAVVGSR